MLSEYKSIFTVNPAMKKILSLLFVLIFFRSTAQVVDTTVASNLKKEIYFLADDALEGRNTGSAGEEMAIQYITSIYGSLGIAPKGTKGYVQHFEFNYGIEYNGENKLSINNIPCRIDTDFFPLSSSGSSTINANAVYVEYGIDADTVKLNNYKKITGAHAYIINLGSPDGESPHSKYYPYTDVSTKIQTAIKHQATAIIFINTNSEKVEDIKKDFTKNSARQNIPIVFLNDEVSKKISFVPEAKYKIDLTTSIEVVRRNGNNIVGFIDNDAPKTIVIGAHFDHLGLGHDGNSLYTGPTAIHNGADDNASGTAGVIELARWAASGAAQKNNYLLINFSGEELGLLGSKYFVEHSTIDTSKINYMINMDMIGRYRADKGLEISGIGTSPYSFDFIRHIKYDSLKIKIGEQGTGPSDHTSFYYANIPVLNFFTGAHEDYHKPTDDANKINYEKEANIIHLITMIIDTLNNDGELSFHRTQDSTSNDLPNFKVRLGIIPDYMFEQTGLRIDGVNENQPAQKAGLLKGDVILQIGNYPTPDIMAYMKALSMFQKGDKAKLKYSRNNVEAETEVQF